MQPILYFIRKEFKQIFRAGDMVRVIFAVPLMQMLVLGWAVSTEVKNVSLIIADQDNGRIFADECLDNQNSQAFPEMIDVPTGMTEEAVIVREVSVPYGIAGHDQVGDIAMPGRKNPPRHQQLESSERRSRKDRPKAI
jgi:hypothetical protein